MTSSKELRDEIERYQRELDNLVVQADGEPIMISIDDDNEIGGVSYQGEFLELIRQHRNRVIKITYNQAIEEVEKMIDNNCKCFCPNYDVLKKELEEMKKQ